MTLTEQVKILNDKIKANKAQYDLDRGPAKISALLSGEFELLTDQDLGYKPDVIRKANFNILCLVNSLIKDWMKVTRK